MKWFTYVTTGIQVAKEVMAWFERANKDGKITAMEAMALINKLARKMNIKLELDVPPEAGKVVSVVKTVL